ncbi:hypothetical protein ABW636_17355 [Aquimarina sp. 2201CG1-2-11]|uniref:hypothetical protein n=1 Tax=Aquimarina discodermiae TaxID=3231043 RepID=UPI0034632646
MKNKVFFFGIWCLFLTLSGYAQNESLKSQLRLLQIPSDYSFPLDSTGFSAIKNAKFYTKNGDIGIFDINGKNIHIVDLNRDGIKDIIYQDDRHYQAIIVFLKKGNDFVEIWNGSGVLVDITYGEKNTIHVLTSAIGCFDMILLSELSIKKDNSIIENTVTLHSDTKISTINTVFEQKIISGILRSQPIIDDTKKKDSCTEDMKEGNQLQKIKSKEVTVIQNKNGWLQVVLKEKDNSIIGWIKA